MSREAFLTEQLQRFLTERRVAPKSLSTPQARADETKALARIVLTRAPRDGFEEWWDEVERFIGSHADTRAWPTEKEMLAATHAARVPGKTAGGPREEFKLDPAMVAANKIKAGEAVGEDWLWGRLSLELTKGGLVSEYELQRYRDAFAKNAEAIYGKPEAARMMDERRARHRDAMAVERGDIDYFENGDGSGAIRPRMMADAIRGPADDRAWERESVVDDETGLPRPYTDAERARIAALRPQHEEQAHG